MSMNNPGGNADLCDFIISLHGDNDCNGVNKQMTSDVLASVLSPLKGTAMYVMITSFYNRIFEKGLDWSISGNELSTSTNYMAAMDDTTTLESMSGYFSIKREKVDGQLVPTRLDMGATIVEGQNMVQFISDYAIGAKDIVGLKVFARNAVPKPREKGSFLTEYNDGYLYTVKENGEYIEVKKTDSINEWRPETVIGTVEIDEFFEAMTYKDDEKLATCTFTSFQKSTSDTKGRI